MKKAQAIIGALGGAGGVILLILIVFLIVGNQQIEVRKIELSVINSNILSANYSISSVSKFKLWFNSNPSGYYNIQIYDENNKNLLQEYSNIGGFDFIFYSNNLKLRECIYLHLLSEPYKKPLGYIRKICLSDGGETWS